eukprot:11969340-Karenia_brevis.AAC.1
MFPGCAHPGADALILSQAWLQDARIRRQMCASPATHVPQMHASGGGCAHFRPIMASRCAQLGSHARICS